MAGFFYTPVLIFKHFFWCSLCWLAIKTCIHTHLTQAYFNLIHQKCILCIPQRWKKNWHKVKWIRSCIEIDDTFCCFVLLLVQWRLYSIHPVINNIIFWPYTMNTIAKLRHILSQNRYFRTSLCITSKLTYFYHSICTK